MKHKQASMGEAEQLIKTVDTRRREYKTVVMKDGIMLWHGKISFGNESYYNLVG